jgi:competence protein ComEC
MITQILILVALVWSLCPFLPMLPFAFQWFYAPAALCAAFVPYTKKAIYGVVIFAAAAIGITQLNAIGENQLPSEWDGKLWQGEIKVQQIRLAASGDYAQVQAQIISPVQGVSSPEQLQGKIISLGWPKAIGLQQGQHWQVSVKLRRLRGLLNPAGIDFTAYNLSQGISLNGQIQFQPAPILVKTSVTLLDGLQNHFKNTLANTQAPEYSRFYLALALGDTTGLTQQDWQILQNTGTVHLMAISGFQIGLMASLGFWLGLFLAKPISLMLVQHTRIQHWPRLCLPALMSILFASFYTYLANFSLPAERAWVACILLNCAWLLGLRASLLQLWLLCVVLALFCHPLAPLNTGFWLSYCAVAALLYFSSKKSRSSIFNQAIEAQWIITLALTLPQLALNIPLSTTGFFANIIVAPWISIVITPLVFLLLAASVFGDVRVGFFALDHAYFIAWWTLEKISQLPATLWWPDHALNWRDYLLAVLASLLMLLPRSLGFFYLGIILMWLSLFCPRQKMDSASIEILDVGQGLAVVIQTAHHTVLFDAGPSFSARFDAGTHILTPYLMAKGVKDIDIFISRDSAEHAGGLRGLKRFNWGTLTTGEPLAEYPSARLCEPGLQGDWDFVHWQVIAPVTGSEDYSRSCAIKLTIGARSIYLFGDISVAQQRALINQEQNCCAYIVLAPGQGAKNQHLPRLAQQLKPTYVVFSNAAHNRYQHPNSSALQTYQQLGSQPLLTAQLGALRWYWPSQQAQPQFSSLWPQQRYYWYPSHSAGNLAATSLSD